MQKRAVFYSLFVNKSNSYYLKSKITNYDEKNL